jgi:diguanylate cyclase (GGDEF)-like protein
MKSPLALESRATQSETLRDAVIMMVDDEPIVLEVIEQMLQQGGYTQFRSTSRALEAMDLLTEARPEVLLLDLMMPDMNGLQILSRMRIENVLADVPVIVLTSSTDPALKLKALELGASDFLAKPVDPSELVLRVGNTLASKRHRDRLANYDALTSIPNRKLFVERLEWAVRQAQACHQQGAVLHMGLDGFRRINHELGPRLGDLALERIAQRLENCLRTTDTVVRLADGPRPSVSRFGGDEFDFLLPLIHSSDDAARFAERVLLAVSTPLAIADRPISITCSIGICTFPSVEHIPDRLLRNAAIALQQAKEGGRNGLRFYESEAAATQQPSWRPIGT